MTIVHLSWTLGIGGAEEMLVDIVNEQSRTARVMIIIVNYHVDQRLSTRLNPSVRVVQLNRRPGSWSPEVFLRLNWLIHQTGADIVHAHSWSFAKALQFTNCSAVLTVHTTRDAELFDGSIRRYKKIFAVSNAVATQIRNREPHADVEVVMNGIRCTDVHTGTPSDDGLFRMVQVSRLEHAVKGQDVLIRALDQLRRQPGCPRFRLDLIGDGASRPYLEAMVAKLGLEKVVRFRGALVRPTVYSELCDYDLLVQASRVEGFGLSIAEAAGIPVLVSDLGGPREIVDDGRCGFLFDPEDEDACCRQILRIYCMKGTHELAVMLARARARVLSNFDVTRTANEYLRAYRDVLGEIPQKAKDARREHGPSHLPSKELNHRAGRLVARNTRTITLAAIKRVHLCLRNSVCGLLALGVIASGSARRAQRKIRRSAYITAIYFHNPSGKLFKHCITWLIHNGYTFISAEQVIEILHSSRILKNGR